MKLQIGQHVVMVDSEDLARVEEHKWYVRKMDETRLYVYGASGEVKGVALHRFITGAVQGEVVDHIDRNTLNNQKSNLRRTTVLQNRVNSKLSRNNSSGYRGVYWHKPKQRWRAVIGLPGNKRVTLGQFTNPEAAAKAYDAKAKEVYGEFASLNFPPER